MREDVVGVSKECSESRSISSFKLFSLLQGTNENDYSLTNGTITCDTASMGSKWCDPASNSGLRYGCADKEYTATGGVTLASN